MNEKVSNELKSLGWDCLVKELESPVGRSLRDFLVSEKKEGKEVFPDYSKIFQAFRLVPFDKAKVIIIGQDPYHTPDMATGLAFGVPDFKPRPPSLRNIFKEIDRQYDLPIDKGANSLEGWASQGVLLINTCLTVEAHKPFSHTKKGWEEIIDNVIKGLNADSKTFRVFVMWGEKAKEKAKLIGYNHSKLESGHPSPLSFGKFLGNGHFEECNQLLARYGKNAYNKTAIDWHKVSNSVGGEYERNAVSKTNGTP